MGRGATVRSASWTHGRAGCRPSWEAVRVPGGWSAGSSRSSAPRSTRPRSPHGWIDEADPRFPPGSPRHADAATCSSSWAAAASTTTRRRFIPVDPSAASDQLVVPLAQQGSELLAESARWNDTSAGSARSTARSSLSMERPITEVHGIDGDQPLHRHPAATTAAPSCSPPSRTAGGAPTTLAQAEQRDVQAAPARRLDADALPALGAAQPGHPGVRRRGHRPRRGGPHLRRVLQAAAGLRPAHRAHPGHREPRRGGGDPRQVGGRLPRRHLRPGLGAGLPFTVEDCQAARTVAAETYAR